MLSKPKSDRRAAPWMAAAIAAMLGLGALGSATAADTASAPRITGMWLLDSAEFNHQEVMPLTPMAAAKAEAERKAIEQGHVLSDAAKKCLPEGMPWFMVNEFALEILESPGRVTMLSESSPLPRSIYLFEAAHPSGLEPSWNGHSIGKWQGDTLVVDTINFNDRLDGLTIRGPHSPTTHLTERFHLKDPDTLVGEMTFVDPVYLTKPWTVTHVYHRLPLDAELWEYPCEVDAAGWSERFSGDPGAKAPDKAN